MNFKNAALGAALSGALASGCASVQKHKQCNYSNPLAITIDVRHGKDKDATIYREAVYKQPIEKLYGIRNGKNEVVGTVRLCAPQLSQYSYFKQNGDSIDLYDYDSDGSLDQIVVRDPKNNIKLNLSYLDERPEVKGQFETYQLIFDEGRVAAISKQ